MSDAVDDTFFPDAVAQLSLDRFASWAGEEGGPLDRDDSGRIAWIDPDDADSEPQYMDASDERVELGQLRPVRLVLEDSTIEQDKTILKTFGKYLAGLNRLASSRNEALYRGDDPDHLASAFPGWHRGLLERGLKPSTIERYLVAARRYARFRGVQGEMLTKSAPFNRRKRGEQKILSKTELNDWLTMVRDSPRVELATWLLLAGVPVSKLTDVRYGEEIKAAGVAFRVELEGEDPRSASRGLAALLDPTSTTGAPVLASAADSEVPIAMPTLRQVWNRYRRGSGPSMRDIQVIARRIELDRTHQGELTWTPRSSLSV